MNYRSSLALQMDRMVGALEALVNAESPSSELSATAQCAEVVASLGKELLGADAEWMWADGRPHLRWKFGGPTEILVLGHFDTVWPLSTLERIPFRTLNGRATGPGVFDMKAGIVQGFFGLNSLPSLEGVTVLLNSDEEVSSLTSRPLIEEAAMGVGAVLVLEPSDGGRLKRSRKGVSRYTVTIEGLAAHVGLDPELGKNALTELAHQVLATSQISDPDRGTFVVPTVGSAGSAVNVVPAAGSFEIDVRCDSVVEQERVDHDLRRALASVTGSKVSLDGGITRPVFEERMSAGLVQRATRLAERLGIDLETVSVGGGSDGNFTAALGIPTLDGLGAVGAGAHADHEYVSLESMPERAAFFASLVEDLLANPLTIPGRSS